MLINAKMVNELREKTGVGLMECKKALTHTNGDMDEALKYYQVDNKFLQYYRPQSKLSFSS